jgi:hypothetical protein
LEHLFSSDPKYLSVVTGCKNHGKSQILYFTAQMLIELGEIVIYLDKTIFPNKFDQMASFETSCVSVWRNCFTADIFEKML